MVAAARARVVAHAARSDANRQDLYDYCYQAAGLCFLDAPEPEGLPSYLLLGYSDIIEAAGGLNMLDRVRFGGPHEEGPRSPAAPPATCPHV